jgi:hypothetical protein
MCKFASFGVLRRAVLAPDAPALAELCVHVISGEVPAFGVFRFAHAAQRIKSTTLNKFCSRKPTMATR